MIDPSSKQLIWRGAGQARIREWSSPEDREKRIAEAVKEILEKFPPGAEKG